MYLCVSAKQSARNSTKQITKKLRQIKKNRLKTTIFQNLEIPQGELLHKSLANSLDTNY